MNDWIGKSLGKVRIDSLLARGGMAEVYLGTHTTLKRQVAVKILRNQYEDDADLLARFEREAQVVAKLRHHNIVQVFDFDSIDERPYIVMEYVSGASLSQYLAILHKNNKRLEISEVNKILTGVANALHYAHESGVIHRDIKPGNIILTSRTSQIVPGEPLPKDFEPLLTDFGLVRFLNSSRQTSAGQTAGTPAYMSPEQARGETTDARTDIYSLGIVLYEMLAGNVPFDGETTVSILLKHIADPLPPIRGLANPLLKVLDKALAKAPGERYQTPVKFAHAFEVATEAKAEPEPSTLMEITPVTDPSAIPYTDPAKSLVIIEPPPTTAITRSWRPMALGAVALALLGVIFMVNGFAPKPQNIAPTLTQTIVPSPEIALVPITSIVSRTAVLHFRDADAIMDQAVLEALTVPAPPDGTQYEVWLAGPDGRVSLGILLLDADGKGTRTYNANTGENLLAKYDHVEVIIKPVAASSNETEHVVYSYTLPADGLVYIRQLLVADPEMPNQMALVQNLSVDTQLLEQKVNELQKAYANRDQTNIKKSAEAIINLIVGSMSQDHKDWNGDGQISDPGNGYGFLLNGNNLGDVQAVFSHADYVANSAGASQNMIARSDEVKICAENLAQWLPQLKELIQQILIAASPADMEKPIQDTVELTKKIRDGIDLNGNAAIEPILGECGVTKTYESAYAMADMPLLPVLVGSPTATTGTPAPVGTVVINTTVTKKPSSGNTPIPAQPTKKNPTGGGGGGAGGGGNGGGNGNGNGHNKP